MCGGDRRRGLSSPPSLILVQKTLLLSHPVSEKQSSSYFARVVWVS